GRDPGNFAGDAGRHEDPVFDDLGFRGGAKDIAAGDLLANLYLRGELPFALAIEGDSGDASADEVAGAITQGDQGALDAVEGARQQAGSQFYGQGESRGHHFFAEVHAFGALEHLGVNLFAFNTDHLAHQAEFADTEDLTHGDAL